MNNLSQNKISIIVPVYNEEKYITQLVNVLQKLDFGAPKEIIVVDNNSTDRSLEILKNLSSSSLKVISYNDIQGRGAALKAGVKIAQGNWIAFQDADMEIPPRELVKLYNIAIEKKVEVVFGSRLNKNNKITPFSYWGNKLITALVRLLYKTTLSDSETGCIIIKNDLLEKCRIDSLYWEHSLELIYKLTKLKTRLEEVPVEYRPRKSSEGKKMNQWKEGVKAVATIFRLYFKGKLY